MLRLADQLQLVNFAAVVHNTFFVLHIGGGGGAVLAPRHLAVIQNVKTLKHAYTLFRQGLLFCVQH